jgi:L-threonylcarbamoyladenylate synthase
VVADLGDRVDYVLDGGPCPIGVESTIVDCTTHPAQILRPGGISTEEIDALLGGELAAADGPSRASGMLASHYAPSADVVLSTTPQEAAALAAAMNGAWVLDHTDDLVVYAHALYAELRAADERGVRTIIAVMPPQIGLGHAIRDRLAKAAAGTFTSADPPGD